MVVLSKDGSLGIVDVHPAQPTRGFSGAGETKYDMERTPSPCHEAQDTLGL